ncbi:MAG: hypothetical protein ACJZ12_02550 [Candidatus Neomarinimicrobiota bacterium]
MKSFFSPIFFLFSLISAEITNFEHGLSFYEQRALDAVGLKAKGEYIDNAINQFSKVMEVDENNLDAGIYLLKCYYYKGKFVAVSDEKKKEFFNKGKILGETLIELYPKSVEVYYWYLVNLGSWAEIYGILSAAKEGVANTMRRYSNIIIKMDSTYGDGGGFFLLGAVHLKSPYIPFILSWPSHEKALYFLSKAYDTGDSTPSQTVYLARALYKNNHKQKAISMLFALLDQDMSKKNILEDMDQYEIARKQLVEWE